MKNLSNKCARLLGFVVVVALLSACSATRHADDTAVSDPLEGMNRGTFWFNEKFDDYVLGPVARGYKDVTPSPIRTGVGNFFKNLRYPVYLVSDLIQFKFTQAAEHTGRFLVNTTAGVLGFVDVAEDIGLEDHQEDLGIALAYYGVPAGPYLVLPFVGPSNVRDTVGFIGALFLDPLYFVRYTSLHADAKLAIAASTTTIKVVNMRADLDEGIKSAKESSIDYYLFLQGAYYQYRRGLLYDGAPPDDDVVVGQE